MLARRTFLWASAVAIASVGLMGAAVWVRGTVLRTPARPLRYLSRQEFSILAAVADRLVRGPGLPSAAELQVAENVDGVLARMHPADADEVRSVLHLLENALAGLALDGRISTFSGSPPDVQDRVLASWSRARVPLFRTAYRALHGLCLGAAWGDPAMYAHAGYAGPPVGLLQAALVPAPPDPAPPDPAPTAPTPEQPAAGAP